MVGEQTSLEKEDDRLIDLELEMSKPTSVRKDVVGLSSGNLKRRIVRVLHYVEVNQ